MMLFTGFELCSKINDGQLLILPIYREKSVLGCYE